jgi:hypothetical protein
MGYFDPVDAPVKLGRIHPLRYDQWRMAND